MFSAGVVVLLGFLSALLCPAGASQPTYQDYIVYGKLEKQLLTGKDGLNLYTLAEVFYPKVGPKPICVPISYTLLCPNASEISNCTDSVINCTDSVINCTDSVINCTEPGYRTSFLWTQYDLSTPIGPLLLSYAWDGITLKGFDWEDSCNFEKDVHFDLNVSNVSCRSEEVIKTALKALTAVVKFYAKHRGNSGSLGDSDTKGYAQSWNYRDKEAHVFHASRYTLVSMIVVLNLFVFLIVVAMTTYTYDTVYDSIIKKRNPNYPLFWSFVLLSFFWNVGPSWLVLSRDGFQIYYSLIVMIPLEFLVAVLVKKKSDFPVPFFRGCLAHSSGYHYSWEWRVVCSCIYCLVSHVVQTFAIWTILVFLTFLSYYISSIIVAFYLYPTQVLIKVLFLKAVAISAVLNVALLFANSSKFKCHCSWKSFKHDLGYIVRVLAIAAFMPILAFLAFVIGGILFSGSGQASGLQGVLTLLPSLFLMFGAWFTKGRLFPKGTNEPDLGSDILHNLEDGEATKHTTKDTPAKSLSPARSKSGELSSYNSIESQPPPTRDSGGQDLYVAGEQKPLLH